MNRCRAPVSPSADGSGDPSVDGSGDRRTPNPLHQADDAVISSPAVD